MASTPDYIIESEGDSLFNNYCLLILYYISITISVKDRFLQLMPATFASFITKSEELYSSTSATLITLKVLSFLVLGRLYNILRCFSSAT
jgi:hypothetical protein